MVKQISVFLENKTGRLAEATRAVGKAGVNIRALSVADTSDFGVLRFICDNTANAIIALKEAGFTATATEVVAAEVPDKPGGLADLLDVLGAKSINVEYMYAFFKKSHHNAVMILKVEDRMKTMDALEAGKIKILSAEDLSAL